MNLQWLRFFSRLLELNEQGLTTGYPEYTVWVPPLTYDGKFITLYAELITGPAAYLFLNDAL